jgi:hypothetical protein
MVVATVEFRKDGIASPDSTTRTMAVIAIVVSLILIVTHTSTPPRICLIANKVETFVTKMPSASIDSSLKTGIATPTITIPMMAVIVIAVLLIQIVAATVLTVCCIIVWNLKRAPMRVLVACLLLKCPLGGLVNMRFTTLVMDVILIVVSWTLIALVRHTTLPCISATMVKFAQWLVHASQFKSPQAGFATTFITDKMMGAIAPVVHLTLIATPKERN